ncbi:hypothetical protein OIU34_22555 [Pararhizobium sp. BT-229]|uniref:hypothetical protein n=1 Tax=Pararhizobium sp. BT-229 TaxID=2986923 RepID=UPI0021F79A50|nr:hypothetical protein [Pararhizobium sp. BT-229]MCV9964675.1 hypothetical protein [Pararhizobium sp. BT-229]
MLMKYSGVIVARDKVEYGYVVAGEEAVFRFVVANVVDHGIHILSSRPGEITEDEIERFADAHHTYARLMSDRKCHRRYIAEVLDYVRSLPRGCRSEQLFNRDEARRLLAEEQVREGLLKALPERDSFRSAMAFEAGTPFLRADRRVVDLMDGILADANRFYVAGEVEFLVRVAEAMQKKVVSTSPFLREQVAKARACVESSNLPSPC